MFCVVQRVQSGGQYKFIEYWAGRGENTKAHDAAGLSKAVMFDKLIHASHDCLTAIGVRLWLDTLALTVERGVVWMATQCSSFIFMNNSQSNDQMVVTSLMFFLAWLIRAEPVLEQPMGSVLPGIKPLSIVLGFVKASYTSTWLGHSERGAQSRCRCFT